MKKHAFTALLAFVLVFSLSAQQAPQQPQMKLEDVQKALSLVDKPQPVPDKYKAGFDAINAKDTMAMLTFSRPIGWKGRETATKGYALMRPITSSRCSRCGASSPAATCPWEAGHAAASAAASAAAPRRPRPSAPTSRTFAFKSVSDVQSSMALEVNKAGAVKSRTFQSGVDYQAGCGRGGGEPGTPDGPGRLRRLRHPGALDRLGRAKRPQSQGQGRPRPDRSARHATIPSRRSRPSQSSRRSTSRPRRPAGRMIAMAPRGGGRPSASTSWPRSRSRARRPSSRSPTSATTAPSTGTCPRPRRPRQRRPADHPASPAWQPVHRRRLRRRTMGGGRPFPP